MSRVSRWCGSWLMVGQLLEIAACTLDSYVTTTSSPHEFRSSSDWPRVRARVIPASLEKRSPIKTSSAEPNSSDRSLLHLASFPKHNRTLSHSSSLSTGYTRPSHSSDRLPNIFSCPTSTHSECARGLQPGDRCREGGSARSRSQALSTSVQARR